MSMMTGAKLYEALKEYLMNASPAELAGAAKKLLGYSRVRPVDVSGATPDSDTYEVEVGEKSNFASILTHEHKYGNSTYLFTANRAVDQDDLPEIAAKLNVDYEPEKNEFLNLDSIDVENIPHIELGEPGAYKSEGDEDEEAEADGEQSDAGV